MSHWRKAILLAVSALALVAVAAPAAAQAEGPWWYVEGEKIAGGPEGAEREQSVPVEATGDLMWKAVDGGHTFTFGPCATYMPNGEIYNASWASSGEGTFFGKSTAELSCAPPTRDGNPFPGCIISGIDISQWGYRTDVSGQNESSHSVKMTLSGCQPIIYPTVIEASGRVVGVWHNPGEEHAQCTDFEETGQLKIENLTNSYLSLSGSLCFDAEGKEIGVYEPWELEE